MFRHCFINTYRLWGKDWEKKLKKTEFTGEAHSRVQRRALIYVRAHEKTLGDRNQQPAGRTRNALESSTCPK